MKRYFYLMFALFFSIVLVSCNNNNIKEDEEVNLEELAYFRYLNDNNPEVTIKVADFGTIKVQLFPAVAENTVNNFLNYALNKQYDGSDFHRIIEGFMIQGGQVNKTNKPIEGEFAENGINNTLRHNRGVISMARTSVMNSATSQFFIMHKPSPHLNRLYASFGGVVSGFDTLDKIATVPTNMFDAPIEKVTIKSVTVELNGYNIKEVVYID